MSPRREALSTAFLTALLLAATGVVRTAEDSRPATTEAIPPGRQVTTLEVFPAEIELDGRFAYRQLLVTGVLDSGERVDVTRLANRTGAEAIVDIDEHGLARVKKSGAARLHLEVGGAAVDVPVRVSDVEGHFEPSFITDVMPVLARLGCNAGTCHGAAKGKNGFKLSLRGYDPVFDHRALTDDLAGRRFNKAAPDRSLFLQKLTGGVPHVGGVLTEPSSPYYEILHAWVAGGAQADYDAPRVASVEVFPKEPILPLPGSRQQFAVLATYTDGRVRDVTAEAFLTSSDTEVAEMSRSGVLTAIRRGESAVLVRFEGRYAATPIVVMGDRSGWEWRDVPTNHYVDELVYEKLRRIKSAPAELCTDAEFLRRVYLDLTGLPPSPKDVRTFLLDGRETRVKREEVIDRLIGSTQFVEHWTNRWADLLSVNRKFLGKEGARALRSWVRQSVASNEPYQDFVYEILTSTGSTLKNPPAAYYKVQRTPEAAVETTTQLFLGVRFSCNKCHDHPFERWTQNQYWELASYFAQVGRKDAPGSRKMPRRDATQTDIPAFEEIVFDAEKGEVKSPDGRQFHASFPYRNATEVEEKGTRREQLAHWITSETNPYFARSYVNRLWSYLLGVGLIDPIDDIRAGNPPSNPTLLDRLTEEFIQSGFDTRKILRRIVTSRTYQHSLRTNRWNEDDRTNFSHALARRLPAETIYDAVHLATGSRTKLPGMRRGSLAAEVLDSSVKLPDGFLDLFGRPPRESACECERTTGFSLGHSLNLVNGPTIGEAIADPDNAITDLVDVERRPSAIVEELFLSFLSRSPTAAERKALEPTFDPNSIANLDALSPAEAQAVRAQYDEWEKKQVAIRWTPLAPELLRSAGGATFERGEGGVVSVTGEAPEKDVYNVIATTTQTKLTGLRLELLPDPRLPAKGPGRAENGNLVLSEISVAAVPLADSTKAKPIKLQNATQSFAQNGYPAGAAIDGKVDDKGWAIAPRFGQRHEAVFEFAEDAGGDGGTLLTIALVQQFGSKHTLGKFRLSVTDSPRPIRLGAQPRDVTDALLTPKEKRTEEHRAALWRHFVRSHGDVADKIRLDAAQDIAWALANSPAFLFNH